MSTLTDRYVDAVAAHLPEGQRADIARELRSQILEAVEGRAPGVDPEAAEREAIMGLGHPATLAAGYRGTQRYLIGPAFYDAWLAVLKILLAILPVTVALVILVLGVVEGRNAAGMVSDALWGAVGAALQVAGWVTLGFVIAERTGADPDQVSHLVPTRDWTPEQLPDGPQARQVGWGDAAWMMVFTVVGIALLSAADRPLRFEGRTYPLLTDTALQWRWVAVAGLVLGVVALAVVMVRGRWSMTTALMNMASNTLVGLPILVLLATGTLFTPEAFELVRPEQARDWLTFNGWIFGVIFALVLLWDVIDPFRLMRKARRSGDQGAASAG